MKKVLLGVAAVFAVIFAAALVYVATLDFNSYKPQIGKAVKDASGLDLVIEGDISLSFSPVGLSLGGVKVSNPQSFDNKPFLTLQSFDVAVELMPLLSQEVKVKYVELSDIDVHIVKSKQGAMNIDVETTPAVETETEENSGDVAASGEQAQLPLIMVDKVLLTNVNISYSDLATQSTAKVEDIDLVVTDINYDTKKQGLKAVSFDGDMTIAKVIYDKYVISKIDGAFAFADAVATVPKLDWTIFDSRATGSAAINLADKAPKISVREKIPALKLAVLAKTPAGKNVLEGTVDTSLDLKFSGTDAEAIKKSLFGQVAVVGREVGIIGYDLDKVLGQYDKSQNLDAVDIAAFVVAGPVGTLLTKGGDVGGALAGMQGGKTLLNDLVLKTDIKNGVAKLTDVALATSKNRVAVNGSLDLPRERFKDVAVAVLDSKGCAKYQQTITGTFDKPGIKADRAAVAQVTNMVSSIFNKVKGLAGETQQKECTTPFYQGSVAHPVNE